MVQCEMCGAETGAPTTIKVEGAELDVCDTCADLGTEVSTPATESSGTKYSTSTSPGGGTGSASTGTAPSTGGGPSGGRTRRRDDDIFDSLGELAQDYDARIRQAREARGMSQEELAKELNEKRSLINKLERAEILPNDAIQRKLERYLEIELAGESPEADDWSADDAGRSFTLGEMAERRD